MFVNDLLAQVLQAAPATPAGGAGDMIRSMLPIILIFAIFYFLLFMPMQRQKKQQQKMLRELQNGNTVLTTGGIIGTIVKIDDDKLVLRVRPDNLKLEIARSAVAGLAGQEPEKKS